MNARAHATPPHLQVHSDTPFQEAPPLLAMFVALQDVTPEMGPTLFIPGTHLNTQLRRDFDAGLRDGRRDDVLRNANAKLAVCEAGDVAFFDMRTLHAGCANLEHGGSQRLHLAVTFRNVNANDVDLGHLSAIRHGYREHITLGDLRRELARAKPFRDMGDGLQSRPPAVPLI